jgi:hypothetical protein
MNNIVDYAFATLLFTASISILAIVAKFVLGAI